MQVVPPMDLYFYFKGENGNSAKKGPYCFNENVLRQLVDDFLLYCNPNRDSKATNLKKGGSYKCKLDNKNIILYLKFDEIIYMEQFEQS